MILVAFVSVHSSHALFVNLPLQSFMVESRGFVNRRRYLTKRVQVLFDRNCGRIKEFFAFGAVRNTHSEKLSKLTAFVSLIPFRTLADWKYGILLALSEF